VAHPMSADDFNAAAYWRAPIGAPPEDVKPAPTVGLTADGIGLLKEQAVQETMLRKELALKQERARKLEQFLLPIPPQDLSTEEIQEKLLGFQAQWWAHHRRKLTAEDAGNGLVPTPVLALYDELGKRLTPEQVAADQELKKKREAAAKQAAAKTEADVAALAAQRAAIEDARAKEWAEFHANKEAAWKSAASEAHDQRKEAAGGGSFGARALSGAASFVKTESVQKSGGPTREEYLQQAMDDFGIRGEDEDHAAERRREEEAQWARGGGADADAVARLEAWRSAEQAGNTPSAVTVA